MTGIRFIASPNEDRGASVSSWIISQSSGGIVNLMDSLLNNYTTWNIGNPIKDTFSYYFKKINNNETCQNDGSQTYDFLSVIRFDSFSNQDVLDWNTYYAGKQLEVIIYGAIPWNNGYTTVPIYWFLGVLPTLNGSSSFSLVSTKCLWEKLQNLNLGNLTFNYSQMQSTVMCEGCEFVEVSGNTYFGRFCITNVTPPEPECEDVRNSANQQSLHLVVSDGQNNVTTTDITFNLSDGQNQELAIKTYMNDTLYNQLCNLYNLNQGVRARIMFNGGVCRSACTVRIVAKVYGQSVSVEPSVTPPYVSLDYDVLAGHDVDILRATFEECNDKPVRIEEDLVAYLDGLKSQNTFSVGFNIYQVLPYKIVITGCEALTEWCCDDVTPIEDDSIDYDEYEEPLIEGYGGSSGGGGSDVDISCICDGLTALNTMLSTKLDNLVDGQGAIAYAIENLDVSVDNECVCDNLSSINDTLETINDTISDKEMTNTVTVEPSTVDNINQITVTPCQPIVTNPVNNITVTPSTVDNINQITVTPSTVDNINQITVTPCQPIVTNPVNNITVEPCSPTINVEPSTCDIDLSNLESILEDSLNHGNKSISQIIDDSFNMVNPCDDSETLSIVQALFKVTDDGENCSIKSISEILDEKFLEPQIDIVLDNQLVGHIYKQNYDYRNY